MFFNLPKNYWNNKFWAYMHDPFDKAFDIKGHVNRAKELTAIFGIEQPNEQFWKKADGIASGFERGQITGYSYDKSKSGAVNFLEQSIITHPTGKKSQLKINFSDNIDPQKIWEALKEFIKNEIGIKPGDGGYSDKFIGEEEKFSIAKFFYTHLLLRFRLADENVGGIGALWHRLPADTRFPDHSIWQHNALVSAIQSCFELGENKNDLGLMIFSITPVQGFISNARKLRDYWAGSVLLSWLSFEGIKWIMENLGPDHIIYPSIIDQFLVNEYLTKKWKINGNFFTNKESKIASFPNKFLFIIPYSKADEIEKNIKNSIREAWNNLVENSKDFLLNFMKEKNFQLDKNAEDYISGIFDRQNKNFWEFNWAAVKMLDKSNKSEIKNLLSPKNYISQFNLLEKFLEMIEDKPHYDKSGIGSLYSVSHILCQSALANIKMKKKILRNEEPGEKCQMCGEFEVLHFKDGRRKGANEYKNHIKNFWDTINKDEKNEVDFKENERLCSICFIKRIIHKIIQKDKEHILYKTFQDVSYKSTTEIALFNFFQRNKNKLENIAFEKKINIEDVKKDIAQSLYQSADDKFKKEYYKISNELKIKDRYYAILLMDGDNMGKLINGETISATWESVMHPEIYNKLINSKIDKQYSDNWKKIFQDVPKRNITPAIHLSISEALGDFAVYGVSGIIKKYNGKLIYAGGDDVCAVLPIDYALLAADEIQKYYKSSFRLLHNGGSIELETEFTPQKGKLSINLGKGKDISISAGILICHHKENLAQMINIAHNLLDIKAKNEGGRDSVAIQLRKRSGGDRFFIAKWNSHKLKSFIALQKDLGENVSRSLAYRLAEYKDGLNAMYNTNKELPPKFILNQLDKSGIKQNNKNDIAQDISNVILNEKGEFDNAPLIIAGFFYTEEV